jgi:hypothetical protein
MIAGLRALRTYFTSLGAALPTANGSKHGQLNIKQASVTEDEAYLVLRDSSGTLQYRRLVTTTLGDSTYVNVSGDTMTGALVLDLDSTAALNVRKADDTRVLVVDTTNKQVEIQNGSLIQGWNADGSDQKFFWQASTGTLGIYDGGDVLLYSDAGSTLKFSVDGATGDMTTEGALDHNGTTVGFYGVAPVTRAAAYTVTNLVTDRSYDANATTTAELADVLGTLIADLRLLGLVQ